MKSMIKTFLAITIISLSSNLFAANNQIKLTVKALHNSNERILEENSILFSGDSFKLEVKAKASVYVYAFLLDSSNDLQQLDKSKTSKLLSPGETINFPSSIKNWYELDDNIGKENIIILTSNSKIDVSKINKFEELGDSINIKYFAIKHLSSKLVMRGIEEIKNLPELSESNALDVSSIISRNIKSISNNTTQRKNIFKIMEDSKSQLSTNSLPTRGVKEVRIFEDSAPAVVFIVNGNVSGSGGLISNDGLIFTNSHVVGNAKKVEIYFMPKNTGKYSSNEYTYGMVVNNNITADLALIKLLKNPIGIKPLELADSKSIKIGQDVHAIGHPGDAAKWTYTRGYIGQILRNYEWQYPDDGINRKAQMIIQSQTPIMGGNSGGPLLNDEGQVIGVNSYVREFEGAKYSVSVKDLKLFLNENFTIPEAPSKSNETLQASNDLKANVIKISESDYDGDGVLDTFYFLDNDFSGIYEAIVIVISNTNELVEVIDFDENGKWDIQIFDTNNNNVRDSYIYDDDEDGEPDHYGYDDDEDGKIDRYEEVE